MKILDLRLLAFGPFTDLELDFSKGTGGLHMVFGPNEAGKSSALRALRHMLFGIPVRTTDSFLHPNPRLRIGARLQHSRGEEIVFIRRKGQRKTLRGADDKDPLDDAALAPFLGGVTRDIFEQMFAIGHDDLVRGGEEIISGGGSVGQALFAAGAGLIRLQQVRQDLDAESDMLFKPSGSKPRINYTISALKAARKSQREALLPAKTWKTHHQALGDAGARLEMVQQELVQRKQASSKLVRIRDALPLIARKKEIDAALVAYEGVPELPGDFGEQRRRVENTLAIAANDYKRAQQNIADIDLQMAALLVPETLIQHAAVVEELQQDLGSYNKAHKDRPGLVARMRTLNTQAVEKLGTMGLDEAGGHGLTLPPAIVGDIQELGKTYERLNTRLQTARKQHRGLETEIKSLADQKKRLPAPRDVTAVAPALQAAQDAGPLDKQLGETRRTIADRETTLVNTLKRQTLWSGTLDDVDHLPCPDRESIDRFQEQFAASTRQLDRLEEEKTLNAAEAVRIDTDLQTLVLAHDVPTEENLAAARSLRDSGWELVRRRLDGSGLADEALAAFQAQFDKSGSLPDAFEESMVAADHVADRLRREAAQVSKKGMLEAQKIQCNKKVQAIASAIDDAEARHTQLDGQWKQLWVPAGIVPLSPSEMRAWASDMAAGQERLADIRSQKNRADSLVSDIDALKDRLIRPLAEAGKGAEGADSLTALIHVARPFVAAQEALKSQFDAIEKELLKHNRSTQAAAADIQELEDELDAWKVAWAKRVQKIGLDADASPTAALAVIESIREARAQLSEADILKKRIDGIDHDAHVFQQRVEDLVNSVAPDLKDEAHARAAVLLFSRLTAAREAQSTQTSMKKQLAAVKRDQEKARKRMDDAATLINALCRDARCQKPEDLPEVERRANTRDHLASDREALENRLRGLSAGATVDAWVLEASAVAADSIAPELERLAGEIDTLDRERSELDQAIGTERAELKRMDGSARAAEYAEAGERLLATLESDVANYARIKIASVILSRTIEQYREKHQGPLIRRASELFAKMTRGGFAGVRADYDDKGNPVLVGVRQGRETVVTVDGMSDGTADQLYLALRLASLEQYLEHNEPLPFVVDDILLRFDDDRSMATLKVLCELSEKTQVIFFTHHRHLVELVENRSPDSAIVQHTLGSADILEHRP